MCLAACLLLLCICFLPNLLLHPHGSNPTVASLLLPNYSGTNLHSFSLMADWILGEELHPKIQFGNWLDMDLILPFKIGDLAESKSFVKGFTGAWFRSKIIDMCVTESGHLEYHLEYIDYTEEDNEWIRVFQKNPLISPACGEGKSSESTEIMMRPAFPQWYRGKQVPEHFPKNELLVSICDTWKVGDKVDWRCEDCYWTAEIIRLNSKDVVQVMLLDPPMGEGGQHPAKKKDLRPALDWSIIKGWTVPLSTAKGKCWQAARLVHPKSDTEESITDEDEAPGSPTIKRPSSDTNGISPATEKLGPTHESSGPSRRGTRSSSKRQISPATAEGAATAEPSGLLNGKGSCRRYPFRVRRNAAAQQG